MTKATHHGFVDGGKLHILNKNRMEDDLRQFKNGDVQIIIKRRGKRSLPQNAYYWGCIIEEIKYNLLDRGYRHTAEEIHEFLKQKFNYEPIVIEATGERIDIGQSTTEMNKDDFSVYVDRIKEWAAQSLELIIPEANTQTQLFAA